MSSKTVKRNKRPDINTKSCGSDKCKRSNTWNCGTHKCSQTHGKPYMKSESAENGYPFMQLIVIFALLSAAMLLRYGVTLTAVYGIALVLVLLPASVSDIRTRTVSNYATLSLFILGTASAVSLDDIIIRFLSAAVIFVPFEIVRIIWKKKGMGGADVKIASGIAFVCGIQRGVAVLFFGLLTAVVITAIRKKNIRESFALIPYLSAAAVINYLI